MGRLMGRLMGRTAVRGYCVWALCVVVLGCASSKSESTRITAPYQLNESLAQAPFGSDVSVEINNYSRVAPYVGVAGALTVVGVSEAKQLGFRLLIDIRGVKEEGVREEQVAAQAQGIEHLNLPMAADARAWKQVATIHSLLEDSDNYPVLIHCGSANRAGALWALYRFSQGIPALIAIEEGRAAGMRSKEKQVRTLLGLRPLNP